MVALSLSAPNSHALIHHPGVERTPAHPVKPSGDVERSGTTSFDRHDCSLWCPFTPVGRDPHSWSGGACSRCASSFCGLPTVRSCIAHIRSTSPALDDSRSSALIGVRSGSPSASVRADLWDEHKLARPAQADGQEGVRRSRAGIVGVHVPIAEHGLIGNLHSVKLVGTDGTTVGPNGTAAAQEATFSRAYSTSPAAAAAPQLSRAPGPRAAARSRH